MPKKPWQPSITFETLGDFVTEFNHETDRAAAILAASYLDHELEVLLRAYMSANDELLYELFKNDAPLGSFSAKIRTAYALGLIPESDYIDLNIIRGICNNFAHKLHGLSFETDSIRDRCRNLRIPAKLMETGYMAATPSRARDYFVTSFGFLAFTLQLRRVEALGKRPAPAEEYYDQVPPFNESDNDDQPGSK